MASLSEHPTVRAFQEKQKASRQRPGIGTCRPRDVRARKGQRRMAAGFAVQQRINRQQGEQSEQPRKLKFELAVHDAAGVCRDAARRASARSTRSRAPATAFSGAAADPGENFRSSHSRRKRAMRPPNSAPARSLPASRAQNSAVVTSPGGSMNAAAVYRRNMRDTSLNNFPSSGCDAQADSACSASVSGARTTGATGRILAPQ